MPSALHGRAERMVPRRRSSGSWYAMPETTAGRGRAGRCREDAGGHDNVTVVYAEGAGFAAAAREAAAVSDVGCGDTMARRAARPGEGALVGRSRVGRRQPDDLVRVGALAGVLATLGLVWRVGVPGRQPAGRSSPGGHGRRIPGDRGRTRDSAAGRYRCVSNPACPPSVLSYLKAWSSWRACPAARPCVASRGARGSGWPSPRREPREVA